MAGRPGGNILIRFDELPPIEFTAVKSLDGSTTTVSLGGILIDDTEVNLSDSHYLFFKKITQAKIMRVSTIIYQQGSPIFEFNVAGLQFPVPERK